MKEKILEQIKWHKEMLRKLHGCGSSQKITALRKQCRANIERLEMQLWKLENPESFENHKKALTEYVSGTHIL